MEDRSISSRIYLGGWGWEGGVKIRGCPCRKRWACIEGRKQIMTALKR
jgi:hypothetical protein